MKNLGVILSIVFNMLIFGQNKSPIGDFENIKFEIKFNSDSTFVYKSKNFEDPIGNFYDDYYTEDGQWISKGDTIILNPNLEKKNYGYYEFLEAEKENKQKVYFKFNIIRKNFGEDDNLVSIDTLQIKQLDFAINSNDKKNRSRITQHPTTRCFFAGFIPKELITNERSFEFKKSENFINKIYIGSYEMKKTEEFTIKNTNSNSFVLNIYQNIYKNSMIRNKKYLMLNKNIILIEQKENGKFKKDGLYYEYYHLKRK